MPVIIDLHIYIRMDTLTYRAGVGGPLQNRFIFFS